MSALLIGSAAFAQEEGIETVTVTGYRASLEKSLDLKRSTNEMIDAISAEDVGKFPDSNLAESLQRLPGVAVDRDNGEGRSITVRGLGSNFTRVTLNGLQALSTAGASDSGTAPNRDRGFDFNTFASELFSSLKVQKSASAATEDGSLGATVSLETPHAFDMGDKAILSMQNAWYENGKPFNPRFAGLVSHNFGEKFGVVLSGAYTIKNTFIDSYGRNPGQSDFTYRQATFTPDYKSLPAGSYSIRQRSGFAAPTGTSCNGVSGNKILNGIIPGNNISYQPYCDLLRGSDSAAYNAVESTIGTPVTVTAKNSTSGGKVSTSTSSAFDYTQAGGSQVIIPSLPTLNHQQLYVQRIGLTGGAQYQVDDNTLVSFDALYSTSYQNSINYQVSPIGLNRNNTKKELITAKTSTNAADIAALGGMFTTCSVPTGTADQAQVSCYGPKQLAPIDYYTNPAYGFRANGADAIAAAMSFVGRPSTKLISASTGSNGLAANKLVLDNVDFRSGADQAYYTVEFTQMSLNATHKFSSRLRADATLGWSHSRNHQTGLLAEVNHMDNSYAQSGQYFTWDDTQGGDMPTMQFGFDVANPANWTMVKNYSALRHMEYYTDNKYRTASINGEYDITDWMTLRAGFQSRIFDFNTAYYQRAMKDVINPNFQEAGVTTAQMTQSIEFGSGLSLPTGTPTSFIAPNLTAFRNTFGFDCNCINDYGDWRIWNKFNAASTGTAGQTYNVSEHVKAYYMQGDFQEIPLFGNTLRGNLGARFVTTEIKSLGHALQGQPLSANSSYNDFLPSVNLAYSLGDDMVIRAAASKVIARPSLQYMAPSITAMTIPTSTGATTGATVSIGNPNLKPYRAKTADLGWEWYFGKGAMIAVTGFAKWVSAAPQVVVSSGAISDFLTPDQIALVQQYYTDNSVVGGVTQANNVAAAAYIAGNGQMAATQARNGGGGVLEGLEITYQQPLDFVPAVFGGKGFGVNANYTKLYSKMHYVVNATQTATLYGDAPWNGASPDAWNATLYYDGPNWSARISGAFRSKYLTTYPVAGGSDQLGYGDSPLVQDFGYSKNTLNVDFSANYDISENMDMTLDALNLTNQADRRWAYQNSPQTTKYASSGRQVFLGFRLKY
ncbi:TonB-dependent receptor [Rhizomicrobium palustre]|uniref:TonB-dependent receptor n=1 Tax=Rhizomicrobium palustre TaxID=189966 RepID=A0A846MU37_9PROT|nr:TonB-dependent receptor [Rhizomicrobium palustre]NIK86745.1 TonB-dependent receptor [Rhizomicrobium palustre]